MNLSEKIHLILYRIREKGLEVFLLSREKSEELHIPHGKLPDEGHNHLFTEDKIIQLDPFTKEDGNVEQAYALEGDWHDIPSLKSMIREDLHQVKDKLEEIIPELEKGTFVAVKEALKKVMPQQYAFLKELKEVITDRNSVKDI